eukprot:545002-Pyramimonas_sp.AAC.1
MCAPCTVLMLAVDHKTCTPLLDDVSLQSERLCRHPEEVSLEGLGSRVHADLDLAAFHVGHSLVRLT